MDKQTQKNLLELVKRNYEEIAEDFDITRKKPLWPELVKLAGMVKDGDKILDVGCGNGRLLQAFVNKRIEYLGVDNSERLIEAARKNMDFRLSTGQASLCGNDKEEMAARNDKYAVVDILELDKLPENNFDYVFCVAVLHHLPGNDLRVRALEQMKGKLKPGGKIIITVWNLWNQKKFRRLILKYGLLKLAGRHKMDFGDILFNWKNNKGEQIGRRYYHAFTKNQLKKLALAAGLKIEKIYKDKYNYYSVLGK
ncbi:MAG: class I SAM-dependent methyltransferase [Patescibacteria group bacterium]|jgi:SAM-dependent methyltransferase